MHVVDHPINYTKMYQILTTEIEAHGQHEPFLVSWMTDAQKHQILGQWTRNPRTEIGSIVEPYAKAQFDDPQPDFNAFAEY